MNILNVLGQSSVWATIVAIIKIRREKSWILKKDASSRESYLVFSFKMIGFNVITVLLPFYIICAIKTVYKVDLVDESIIKAVAISACFLLGGVISYFEFKTTDTFGYKDDVKYKILESVPIKGIFIGTPSVLASTLISITILEKPQPFFCVIFGISFVFLLLGSILLSNGKKTYRYPVANIVLTNGKTIPNIAVSTLRIKHKLIFATEIGESKEYRVKVKDVEHIEYTRPMENTRNIGENKHAEA